MSFWVDYVTGIPRTSGKASTALLKSTKCAHKCVCEFIVSEEVSTF